MKQQTKVYDENIQSATTTGDGSDGPETEDGVIDEEPGTGNESESVLGAIKKLLGVPYEESVFDVDIMMNINAAIFTLKQLGIDTKESVVTSADTTFSNLFGDQPQTSIEQIKMYLFYKTKLGFDPPSSSAVMECIKEMIKEAEWRLNVSVDPPDTFDSGGDEDDSTGL